MESRRVKITLEQARKWYKGDNAELKALAEQAFMKEELGTAIYSEIYINGYNMKINFTKEHSEKLKSLLLDMLLNNDTIDGVLGQPLNVVELLHTTSIKGLNNIRISLGKKIEALESQDEWVASIVSQTQLNNLKTSKELVNLIIGYKRHLMEVAEIENKRNILKAQISRMKEEAKTPEDRLKEAEAELAALEEPQF